MARTRKQNDPDVRNGRLVVYMTPEDLARLNEVAEMAGLSRSSLVSSILERLIIGGFSPLVGAKLCWQLQGRFEAQGNSPKGMYFGIRPLPPLSDVELSKRESTQLLQTMKHEMTI